MAEQNERTNFLAYLQEGVDKNNGLKRVKLKYMDVGPRAKKVKIEAPPGHVESLDAQMAKKIEVNDYLIGRGEREMLDIIVK